MKRKYIISGACAGILCGMLGAGGGIVLVPLLLYWAKLEEKQAFATSVFIMLPISIVSAICMAYFGKMEVGTAVPYLIGGFAGGIAAGKIYKKLPVLLLRRAFGAMLIFGGVKAVFFG